MLNAVLMMGGLGLIVGAGLAAASKVFYVYVDPKVLSVEDALPGANCGGCGLPGCSANALEIVAGRAEPNSCVAASEDELQVIAAIMGVTIEAAEPDFALPGCYFGVPDADRKYIYSGVNDCRAAALHGGGMKVCTIGCLGLGTCERACPFDAISMGPEGLPVVNEKRCTGCGTCERACPKHIITLSSRTRRILREYTSDECTTPCQRGCPAGINIREYILQITRGDNHRAVQVVKERNPFPAVIGRICPRPCELECRRNFVDEPVAINHLKRYAADFERESGERILPYKAPATGRRIAVIGGGVEGLSTAYFAARLGHDTTVYEASADLGGLLRIAIARERLPLEILDWDIKGVLDMGVAAETGKALGKDFTIETLLEQGFDAVFLAAGGWDSRLARGAAAEPETPIPGTHMFMDVLKPDAEGTPNITCGRDVVVSGGGRLALDVAKVCRNLGAETITVLLREGIDDAPMGDADVEAFGGSGALKVVFSAGIHRLVGERDQLREIEYVDLHTLEKAVAPAQTLVVASGRFPELIFSRPGIGEADAGDADAADTMAAAEDSQCWEGIQPYKQPAWQDQVGLFADGDPLTDYGAAIKAIGAGRRAAVSIHQRLYGIAPELPDDVITPRSVLQDVDHVEGVSASQRRIMPLHGGNQAEPLGEIERGFDEQMARLEASRCLQCGLICYSRSGSEIQIRDNIAAG